MKCTLPDEDDEEVVIAVNENGQVTERSDQVADYTLRPSAMEDVCLWDFVAKTEKISRHRSRYISDMYDKDEVRDETNEDAECEEGGTERITDQEKMRITMWQFLAEHKEHIHKLMRVWKRDVVPVPIGPPIPRRDQTDTYNRYCRLMLMLFRPWRKTSQLRKLSGPLFPVLST